MSPIFVGSGMEARPYSFAVLLRRRKRGTGKKHICNFFVKSINKTKKIEFFLSICYNNNGEGKYEKI